MVKKLYTESYIEDIASAIRTKNGTANNYTVAQMGDAVRAIPSGGGTGPIEIANGVIEYYKAASGTISANTFVEFVTAQGAINPRVIGNAQLTSVNTPGAYVMCAALSSGRVALIYPVADQGSVSYYAALVTIASSGTITVGTPVLLVSGFLAPFSADFTSATGLDDDGFIFLGIAGNGTYTIAIVCKVVDDVITVGNPTQIATGFLPSDVRRVGDNNDFIVAGVNLGDTWYPAALKGTANMSNLSVSFGSATAVSNISMPNAQGLPIWGSSISILDNSKFIVFFRESTNSYLAASPCSFSGTTISVSGDTQVLSDTVASVYKSDRASSDAAIAIFSDTASLNRLNYSVVRHTGTGLAFSSGELLSGTNNAYLSSIYRVNDGTLIAFYANGSSYMMTESVVTVSGLTATAGTGLTVSSAASSANYPSYAGCMLTTTNRILQTYGDINSNPYVMALELFSTGTVIQPSVTKIDGVTKTQATTSTAGDVWVGDF